MKNEKRSSQNDLIKTTSVDVAKNHVKRNPTKTNPNGKIRISSTYHIPLGEFNKTTYDKVDKKSRLGTTCKASSRKKKVMQDKKIAVERNNSRQVQKSLNARSRADRRLAAINKHSK